MLSPEELVEYKNRAIPSVYSVGYKQIEADNESPAMINMLEGKLKNIKELISLERVKIVGSLTKAVWHADLKKAEVVTKTGSHWDVVGHTIDGETLLYPEEALFLIDIGVLELTYNDVPLSLQRAYFVLLHDTGVTLNQYRVYSHLAILGYKVLRHSGKNVLTKYEKDLKIDRLGIKLKDRSEKHSGGCLEEMDTWMEKKVEFPIVYSKEECKKDVLERLQVIGRLSDEQYELSVDYDVFKCSEKGSFRKSTVQLPDLRVKVISSEEPVPGFGEISGYGNHHQDGIPLILAIVYPDFINYMQISGVNIPVLNT